MSDVYTADIDIKERFMEIDMISLGKRIRFICKKKEWTIEILSEKSKISAV